MGRSTWKAVDGAATSLCVEQDRQVIGLCGSLCSPYSTIFAKRERGSSAFANSRNSNTLSWRLPPSIFPMNEWDRPSRLASSRCVITDLLLVAKRASIDDVPARISKHASPCCPLIRSSRYSRICAYPH
jgi:hypothetical protein